MNSTAVQYAGALRHAGCTLSELRRTADCLTGCAELWDALCSPAVSAREKKADQLCEVEGVGPRTAEYLSLISASMRRYQTDRNRARNSVVRLNDPDKIGAFFIPRFAALHTESLCVAYVDSSCRLIRCDDQCRGSTSKVLLDPVSIPRSAVMCNAAGVVLAHNHPNGEARPSREDIAATQMLVARLAPLDIALVDHCIVAQDSYYSMARGGELQLMMRGHRG